MYCEKCKKDILKHEGYFKIGDFFYCKKHQLSETSKKEYNKLYSEGFAYYSEV